MPTTTWLDSLLGPGDTIGVAVAVGNSPFTFSSENIALCDVSGGAVTVNLPPATSRTTLPRTVKNAVGAATANNITVGGSAIPLEDPNAPGTYSNTTIALKVNGASVTWFYDPVNIRWTII